MAVDIKGLHTVGMKLHKSFYNDSAKIQWRDKNDDFLSYEVTVTKSEMTSEELSRNRYVDSTLVLSILKDDLKDLSMPLRGYKDKIAIYDGVRYSIVDEEESNGSTKNLLKLHIQRKV